ncbi:MAG: hypothetical protein ACE5FH_13210 [Candidatus Zixiibacteriota bacterium]
MRRHINGLLRADKKVERRLRRSLGDEQRALFNPELGCWQLWRRIPKRQAVAEQLGGGLLFERAFAWYPGPHVPELDWSGAFTETAVDWLCRRYRQIDENDIDRIVATTRRASEERMQAHRRANIEEEMEATADMFGWMFKSANQWFGTEDKKVAHKMADRAVEEKEEYIKTGIPIADAGDSGFAASKKGIEIKVPWHS